MRSAPLLLTLILLATALDTERMGNQLVVIGGA